jgi:hypothetical protein
MPMAPAIRMVLRRCRQTLRQAILTSVDTVFLRNAVILITSKGFYSNISPHTQRNQRGNADLKILYRFIFYRSICKISSFVKISETKSASRQDGKRLKSYPVFKRDGEGIWIF